MATGSLQVKIEATQGEGEIVLGAVGPEVDSLMSSRAAVGLKAETGWLLLDVSAKDMVALRAAVNTYLRLIDVALAAKRAVSSD